jgi:hypothetical protein
MNARARLVDDANAMSSVLASSAIGRAGNFTRSVARAADEVVVGLDASRAMLARAVQETDADNVTYLLADASALRSATAAWTRSAASPRCT